MAPAAIGILQTRPAIEHKNIIKAEVLAASNDNSMERLDASKLVFIRNENPKVVPEPNSAAVWAQNVCTDHMVTCKWTSQRGWEAPKLEPYGPFSIMPTASVLHYATECFEGLKLYRGFDGRLRLFRPSCNTHRMVQSAKRIALPTFDPDELEKLIEKLCSVDGMKWLPRSRPGTFLYIRPTMIGTADNLGVQKPNEALLYVILCCYPSFTPSLNASALDEKSLNGTTESDQGLKLLASREDSVRAWPGGFGFAKLGSNYGPSLVAQAEARERGLDQVLWLLGKERRVTEAGASNFFVVWRTRCGKLQLVTAPLESRIILDGVTRRSILQLAKDRLSSTGVSDTSSPAQLEPLEVVERDFTMREVELAVEEDRLVEAFVAGTAFFVTGVSKICSEGRDIKIPMENGFSGKYAKIFKEWLEGIMYGRETHEWGNVVKEEC